MTGKRQNSMQESDLWRDLLELNKNDSSLVRTEISRDNIK